MTAYREKYKVEYEQCGGWCVIITTRSGDLEKFYGFESEAQAMAWTSKEISVRYSRRHKVAIPGLLGDSKKTPTTTVRTA